MITTLFKAFEDITTLIKEKRHHLVETIINHDFKEDEDAHYIAINLKLRAIKKENK